MARFQDGSIERERAIDQEIHRVLWLLVDGRIPYADIQRYLYPLGGVGDNEGKADLLERLRFLAEQKGLIEAPWE